MYGHRRASDTALIRVQQSPIILIGHSIGGLVIKKVCSSAEGDMRSIYKEYTSK
jgi:predicted alpha/beta hydrolase family esterase